VEVDTPQGTLHYAYDDLGRQTEVFTDQSRIEYDHDVLGRLKTVTQVERFGETLPAPEVTTYAYTDVGALESVTLPNGVIAEYTYDLVNRPLSVTHTNEAGVVLSSFVYTYDAVGNRLTAEETFDTDADGTADQTNSFTWTYDALDRLVTETLDSSDDAFDYTDRYAFDLASNRISLEKDANGDDANDVRTNYLYDANDRLLVKTKSTADGELISRTRYEYSPTEQVKKTVTDAAGNVIEQTDYAYNLQQRLTDVAIDWDGDGTVDATAHYEYNADGIRVEKTDTEDGETVSSSYLIDSRNPTGYAQVLEQIDRNANGDIIRAMAFTLGMDVIAQATQNTATGATQPLFFMYDAHGSTRGLLDATGAYAVAPAEGDNGTVQAFTYDAYGTLLGMDEAQALTTLLYSGEQTNPASGLQYLRARYLDPTTGRFNRVDPFAGLNRFPISLQKWLYAGGNPIGNIDPNGKFQLADLLSTKSIITTVATTTAGGLIGAQAGKPIRGVLAGAALGTGISIGIANRNLGKGALGGLRSMAFAGILFSFSEWIRMGSDEVSLQQIKQSRDEFHFLLFETFSFGFLEGAININAGEQGHILLTGSTGIIQTLADGLESMFDPRRKPDTTLALGFLATIAQTIVAAGAPIVTNGVSKFFTSFPAPVLRELQERAPDAFRAAQKIVNSNAASDVFEFTKELSIGFTNDRIQKALSQ